MGPPLRLTFVTASDENRGVADYVEVTRGDGLLVCRARVARSFVERFLGLMGRAGLESGTGLLFPGTSSVHTHFMRFPIDVVFLDSEARIVSVVAALGPWRFAAAKSAASVLELAGGECERLGLTEGDVLRKRGLVLERERS